MLDFFGDKENLTMPENTVKSKRRPPAKAAIDAKEVLDAKVRASVSNLVLHRKANKILDFDIVLLQFLSNLTDDWLIPMTRKKIAAMLDEKYPRICSSLKRLEDAGHLLVVKDLGRKAIIVSPELLNEGWPGKKMRKIRFWGKMIKLMGKENESQFSIHC